MAIGIPPGSIGQLAAMSTGTGTTEKKKPTTGNNSTNDGSVAAQGAIDRGMYAFQNVMSQFYDWQPDKDDEAGNAIKNSFMANMVQSGFDMNLAKDMAYTQSGIAKGNMNQAADLDLRNKTALMNDEFNKGMMSMGGQFEFQNKFAEDQTVRNITESATNKGLDFEFGEKTRENQNIRDINKQSIANADNFEYANRQDENRANQEVMKNAFQQGAMFDYQDKLEDNRNIREMAKYGYQAGESGKQERLTTITKGEQDRYGMMQQGAENRETMREGDRIESAKQSRQAARSRATARAF